MGIFSGILKKKSIIISAPVNGRCIPLNEIPDETFSQGFLGSGVAIEPTSGKICAPAAGEITAVFPTGHAVGMETPDGVEILIHIGIDTVKLEGKHFQIKAEVGDQVKKGDLLVEVDIAGVKADGFQTVTPVIICNTPDFASVEGITGKEVASGDDVISITK